LLTISIKKTPDRYSGVEIHATAESQSALAGSKLLHKNYHFQTGDVKHFQGKGKSFGGRARWYTNSLCKDGFFVNFFDIILTYRRNFRDLLGIEPGIGSPKILF
jgi:hypothetical protein